MTSTAPAIDTTTVSAAGQPNSVTDGDRSGMLFSTADCRCSAQEERPTDNRGRRLMRSLLPHVGGVAESQSLLATESELVDREQNALGLDRRDAHTADQLPRTNTVLILRFRIAKDRNRVAPPRVVDDADEHQVGQQWSQIGGVEQRDERVPPASRVVLKDLSADEISRGVREPIETVATVSRSGLYLGDGLAAPESALGRCDRAVAAGTEPFVPLGTVACPSLRRRSVAVFSQ